MSGLVDVIGLIYFPLSYKKKKFLSWFGFDFIIHGGSTITKKKGVICTSYVTVLSSYDDLFSLKITIISIFFISKVSILIRMK